MKKRIGNDIQFTWHIYRKDGDTQVPESFDGKDVEVKLISPLKQPVTIEDVSIATGVVTFTFRGKHQVTLGNYVAILQENRGEDGMVTIDVVSAVTLVAHSYMEDDGDDGDVIEATSVELTSTISAGGGIEQQQADWAQTDASAVDFIKNKPNLDEYVPKMDDDGHGNMSFYGQGTITMTHADEQGSVIMGGTFGAGGWYVYSPQGRFQTFGNSIYRGTMGFDHDSVVWEKTATQQIPAATTSAPGLMSAADKQKITDIEAVIPEQASATNKLADKDFVNSSVATATATYRGSYNLVSDLLLSVPATQQQVADALATKMAALSITPDNNDYCFVQIPTADATPTEIARIDRYKYDGTAWAYEYSLNNSSFTAAQWAAINSGITSGLVAKLSALPTNSELITLLNGKANTADLAPVATSGSYNDLSGKPTIPTVPSNISAFNNDAGYITEDDVDDVPTLNSDNPVKSGGVFNLLDYIEDCTYTTQYSKKLINKEDGSLTSATSASKPREFAIDDSKEYLASGVQPTSSSNCAIAYYDENNVYLGYEKAGNGVSFETFTDYKLTIPQGAKIVRIYGNSSALLASLNEVRYKFDEINERLDTIEQGLCYSIKDKNIAIVGDSISTHGNSGQNPNAVEITISQEDVGQTLSAYITYEDVSAGLTLGGTTFTTNDIGTEVTFIPTSEDVGKVIGLPLNYNSNSLNVWWTYVRDFFKCNIIPVCWSGSGLTRNRTSSNNYKASYAWHESQIRKCGIRTAGTMNRTAPDVIIITRGVNDFTHSPYAMLTDGYFDNYDVQYPETDIRQDENYGFKEAYFMTIGKLREAYPFAKIVLCTYPVVKRVNTSHFPMNNGYYSQPQYNNAVREIANFCGCDVIEFDKCGITWENMYPTYISDSATTPTHPNAKGHEVMAKCAIETLKNINFDL